MKQWSEREMRYSVFITAGYLCWSPCLSLDLSIFDGSIRIFCFELKITVACKTVPNGKAV